MSPDEQSILAYFPSSTRADWIIFILCQSIKAFNSGYVNGMSEALGLLDENQAKEDYLKKSKNK